MLKRKFTFIKYLHFGGILFQKLGIVMHRSEFSCLSRANRHTFPPQELNKLKTYGFILAIIVGIGGLVVGGAGLAGYFHVGSLSNLAQVDAIAMMTVGGGSGAILLTVGIVGTVKNCKSVSHQRRENVNGEEQNIVSIPRAASFYGPSAWQELGEKWSIQLEILDENIPVPSRLFTDSSRVCFYIPQRVSVNGVEKDFNLNTLIEMNGDLFDECSESVKSEFGNTTAAGWIEIDKEVIEGSRGLSYDDQKQMVEASGCRMPKILEAVVLNLMVAGLTGERLYGRLPVTYTRCSERGNGGTTTVIVGELGPSGLKVLNTLNLRQDRIGVAAVKQL